MGNMFQILVSRTVGSITWRNILITIDIAFFGVMTVLLQLIFDIANTNILSQDILNNFTDRVYVILGIFMLFKLSISFLGYIINPESIVDKEKGMNKLVTRVIVVIVMLIGLNTAFDLMNRAQTVFFPVLPRIVLGFDLGLGEKDTGTGTLTVDVMSDVGKNIAWTIYSSFFTYNYKTCGVASDGNTPVTENNAILPINPGDSSAIDTVNEASEHMNDPCVVGGVNKNDTFLYEYVPFLPLIIAIFVDYVLLFFTIQIAVRAFKLVILRLIAPIPIISYVDPKSSKDGTFSKWLKLLIGTWLELFITLGVLYFIIFMISEVVLSGGLTLPDGITSFRKAAVLIALILGLLFFAKDAPKFISNALGLKGLGLGIGMAGAMAGLGAITRGASLKNVISTAGKQMSDASTAVVEGKTTSGGFAKGRETAKKLNGEGSKGIVGDAINRRIAESHGVSTGTIDLAKQNTYTARDADMEAKVIQDKLSSGQTLTAGQSNVIQSFRDSETGKAMIKNWKEARGLDDKDAAGNDTATDADVSMLNAQYTTAQLGKAESIYKTMQEYGKQMHVHQPDDAEKAGKGSTGFSGTVAKIPVIGSNARVQRTTDKARVKYNSNKVLNKGINIPDKKK